MKLQPIITALARRLHRAPARPSAPRHARPDSRPQVDRWDAGEQLNLAAAHLQAAAALRGVGTTRRVEDLDRVRADYKQALREASRAANRAWHAGDRELVDATAFWDLTDGLTDLGEEL